MFVVIGATVTIPPEWRAAAVFAPLLLTMTTGLRLFASDPIDGSNSA